MRKILILGLAFGFSFFAVETATAKTSEMAVSVTETQVWNQPGQRQNRRYRNNRHTRQRTHSYVTTRIVFIGRQRYRETIRVTQMPNGRTRVQVLNRVRIGHR